MKRPRRRIASYSGRRSRRLRDWAAPLGILACLLAAGACAFVLPGVRFSAWLFAALAGVCALGYFLGRWAAVSRRGAVCRRIFCVLLAAGLAVFAAAEGYLVQKGGEDFSAVPADAVIVLGAGVNGRTPSRVLQSRIDAAEAYLADHPDIPAVLSGGQGEGEEISEARCMYNALTAAGISPDRLHLEEQSATTAENLANSAGVLRQLGVDTDGAAVAVVSSNFHMVRVRLLAQRAGLQTLGVPGKTGWWWLDANYYAREFFALGKTLLFP